MFKSNSGRKFESCIWKYFTYDAATDKSKCILKSQCGDNDRACGQVLVGKNATNLKYHLKSHHKTEHDEFETLEKQRKRPEDVNVTTSHQTKLQLQVKVCSS